MSREWNQVLLNSAWQDKWQWVETEVQEVSPWWWSSLLCSAHALEQVSLRDCGVSLTRDIQELSEYNPVPCGLGWFCFSREVGPDDPLWSLPTWAILWLSDSLNRLQQVRNCHVHSQCHDTEFMIYVQVLKHYYYSNLKLYLIICSCLSELPQWAHWN